MPASYAEAVQAVLTLAASHSAGSPLADEHVPVSQAIGRTASVDVSSPAPLPPFDISAMDGYAVSSAITQSASTTTPLTLTVIGCIAAGDPPLSADDVAQHIKAAAAADHVCYEIMTGAPFPNTPRAFDACIRIEDTLPVHCTTTNRLTAITVTRPVAPHTHRRHAGEDVALGSHLVSRGQSLTAEHVMVLSAVGTREVAVCRRLRVGVVSTGRELQSQIADCNAPYLVATLQSWGCEATHIATIYDDSQQFEQLLLPLIQSHSSPPPARTSSAACTAASTARFDVLISTGAVSMGKFDFVPSTLASLTPLPATVHFHTLSIRPGHPALLASLTPSLPLFALPGNPVAAAVCLRFVVRPYLSARMGCASEPVVWARLVGGKQTKARREMVAWLKGRVSVDSDGGLAVRCGTGKGSLSMQPLLEAGAVWVELPAGVEAVEDGSSVRVYPLQPGRWQLVGCDGVTNGHHSSSDPCNSCA